VAGYSATPLARKLGLHPGTSALLDGAPAGFALAAPGARLTRRAGAGPYDVIVCFCPDRARLVRRWPVLHALTTPAGALWIAWPKRSSGLATDLTDEVVRGHVLAHGRVDVKVCAVDDVWSALKNVIRLTERTG
jgi:hypothetical protein